MNFVRRYAPVGARLLLGLVFFVFGLNGFFQFLPMPPHPGASGAFLGALFATGYMFPLIKGTEVLAGLLLLSNRAVPLGLTLLAPVIVNIFLFHAVLDPSGVALPAIIVALEIFLAWSYRDAFRPMLAWRTRAAPVDEVRASIATARA